MTPKGYAKICEALTEADGVNLTGLFPVPEFGKDVKRITIITHETSPQAVCDALGRAGLLFRESSGLASAEVDVPQLSLDSASRNRTEFSDQNAGQYY